MMDTREIHRGDIFRIKKDFERYGSEQDGGRPCIIISNEMNNIHSDLVEVVYCTSREKRLDLPTHVQVRSTPVPSTVLCEQIVSADKTRLGEFLGRCTESEMQRINIALAISIGIGVIELVTEHQEQVPQPFDFMAQLNAQMELASRAVHAEAEAKIYRNMYNALLDRLFPVANIHSELPGKKKEETMK